MAAYKKPGVSAQALQKPVKVGFAISSPQFQLPCAKVKSVRDGGRRSELDGQGGGLVSMQVERLARGIAARVLPPITKLELFLTEDCNLRCTYCFVRGKNSYNRMSWETARKAVDLLFRFSREHKEVTITFFGGEPLLEWELVKEVLKYATFSARKQAKKVGFVITTNGTLLREEMLLEGRRFGFLYLLSVDGDKETHDKHRKFANGEGSFECIMKRLPIVKEIQAWVGTKMTVIPDTVNRLYDNFRYLVSKGFNQFIIGPDVEVSWNRASRHSWERAIIQIWQDYNHLRSQGVPLRISYLDHCETGEAQAADGLWGCEAGRNKIAVSARGEVFPCVRFATINRLLGAYKLGSVDEGLTDIPKRMQLVIPTVRARCRSCLLQRYCTGGCPAINLEHRRGLFQSSSVECFESRVTAKLCELAEQKQLGSKRVEQTLLRERTSPIADCRS